MPAGGLLASWLGVPPFKWSLVLLGLCVYTFVIVSYYVPAAELGIAIAAVGLALRFGKLRVPFPVVIFAAFVVWAAFAALTSSYAAVALDGVVENLKLLAIMLIVVNAFHAEGQLRFYLLFLLGCFVLFPVRGALIGEDSRSGRVVWNYIYNNPNDLATLCLIALGLALGIAFSKASRKIVRIGAAVSVLLLMIVILLTQSRGAFIGFVAGMGPGLLWMGVKRPGHLMLATGIVVVVVGVAVPATVWDRLSGIRQLASTETIADADTEGSAAERYQIQKTAWRIFIDHPFLGVGLGAYPQANARYAPELGPKDTHNTYLNLAAEVGLPGMAIWCMLVGSVLRFAYARRKAAPSSDLATQQAWMERALWAYLIAALFGSYAKLAFPYLVIAVLWSSASLLPAASPDSIPDGARPAT